ncbi:hypothetical protein MCEKH45_01087 [Methylophilaceae bacterium]
MAQNRRPPAYVEYAATILANRQYRLMSLAERGLLYTIRLECWENIQVPASPDELAKYISCDVSDVKAALTDRVKSFLSEKENSLTCPELEDYRQHLAERREKQSKGGKDGAAITNRSKKKADKEVNVDQLDGSGNSQASRRGTVGSLVKSSTVKSSQIPPVNRGYIDDPFVREMISYDEASNGK